MDQPTDHDGVYLVTDDGRWLRHIAWDMRGDEGDDGRRRHAEQLAVRHDVLAIGRVVQG